MLNQRLLDDEDNLPVYDIEITNRSTRYYVFLVFYIVSFGIVFVEFAIDVPLNITPPLKHGSYFVYFSFITGVMQLLYWTLCIIDHIIYTRKHLDNDEDEFDDAMTASKRFHYFRDYVFAALAFPFGTFNALGFYTLILDFGDTTGQWLRSNVQNAVILVLIWIEAFVTYHKYSFRHSSRQPMVTVLLGFSYLLLVFVCHEVEDKWPYDFLSKRGIVENVFVSIALLILLWAFYYLGRWFNTRFHVKKQNVERDVITPATSK